jgi:hypothetical protein
MEEILLTSRQRMLSPDQLALELNLIETPQEFERNKIINYLLIGGLLMATFIISYNFYQIHQEEIKQKRVN